MSADPFEPMRRFIDHADCPPEMMAKLRQAVRDEMGSRICDWYRIDGTRCPTGDRRDGAKRRCPRDVDPTNSCWCEDIAYACWLTMEGKIP